MPTYLDTCATTPVEPSVAALCGRYLSEEFGNAGSRTHEWGARAKQATQQARDHVAALAGVERDGVVFTSGATESNNLAILGIAAHGIASRRQHVITTAVEHKAVLEPIDALSQRGFEVTVLPVTVGGWVDPEAVRKALRPDTLLVSVMQANNETGVLQPVAAIAEVLTGHEAFFHVDAAQGFGKELDALRLPRVELISVSSHKLFGPKGVGALLMRRRGFKLPPLTPLLFGGGQERGLRPGTLPVHLVVGLGEAARLAALDHVKRRERNTAFRDRLLRGLAPLDPIINGDAERSLTHVVNLSIPGLDSEAMMLALKEQVAISNGSACTSHSYVPSHVLTAMGLDEERIAGATRWSWCHLTEEPDWDAIVAAIRHLR